MGSSFFIYQSVEVRDEKENVVLPSMMLKKTF
jgi:hypothetical protein